MDVLGKALSERKYRRLRSASPAFARLASLEGALELLEAAGFALSFDYISKKATRVGRARAKEIAAKCPKFRSVALFCG